MAMLKLSAKHTFAVSDNTGKKNGEGLCRPVVKQKSASASRFFG